MNNTLATSDIISITAVTLTLIALVYSFFKAWKLSFSNFTKFKTETQVKILEIETKIQAMEKERKDELQIIMEKLDSYKNETQAAHARLYETINKNQRDFYNQITNIFRQKYNETNSK